MQGLSGCSKWCCKYMMGVLHGAGSTTNMYAPLLLRVAPKLYTLRSLPLTRIFSSSKAMTKPLDVHNKNQHVAPARRTTRHRVQAFAEVTRKGMLVYYHASPPRNAPELGSN